MRLENQSCKAHYTLFSRRDPNNFGARKVPDGTRVLARARAYTEGSSPYCCVAVRFSQTAPKTKLRRENQAASFSERSECRVRRFRKSVTKPVSIITGLSLARFRRPHPTMEKVEEVLTSSWRRIFGGFIAGKSSDVNCTLRKADNSTGTFLGVSPSDFC